jgi:UPF0716 protein FxsA
MTTPAAPPPVRPRRSRARTILPLAIAAWLLLEIWLLMTVAEATGGLTVLALLVAGLVLGAVAVKRAGRSAWHGLAAAAGRGGASGSEADSGSARAEPGNAALAMLGGLLLMLPGLVSDVAGLLCLFPPTRALLGRVLLRALERPGSHEAGSLGDLLSQARMRRPDGKIIQGEVVEDGGTATESSGPDAEQDRRPDSRRDPGPQR